MASETGTYICYGEPGSGFWGQTAFNQCSLFVEVFKDQILKIVESIPVEAENDGGQRLFTIGDYGTCDGSTSFPLIRDLIGCIRKKHGQIPIQIIYEDQPNNDFNSLFRRVNGLIPDPPTYLHDFNDVFVSACGTSFYQQVIPANTADLIMSFLSVHWMSKEPVQYRNALFRCPDATEQEQKMVTAQAAEDWVNFLLARSKELKPGGILVVSATIFDPEMKQGVYRGAENFLESVTKLWRRFRDEGKITEEEFFNININRVDRSLEEFRAPFDNTDSDVYRAGLRLISAEQILSPCIFVKAWKERLNKDGVDDRDILAKSFFNQHRTWANGPFMKGLANRRTDREKEAIIDELFGQLEKEVHSRDPRELKESHNMAYIIARKV